MTVDSNAVGASGLPVRSGLRILNLYRLLLIAILFGLHFAEFNAFVGSNNTALFSFTITAYLAITILSIALSKMVILYKKLPLKAILFIDCVFAILIIYTSGGLNNNLSIILLVTIASAGLLVDAYFCLFLVAVSIIGLIAQEYYGQVHNEFFIDYSQAYTSALALIASASLSILVHKRAIDAQKLAAEQTSSIKNLTFLNEYIIDKMTSAVIIVDQNNNIVLHNNTALRLFKKSIPYINQSLASLSEALHIRHLLWQEDKNIPSRIRIEGSAADLQPTFIAFKDNENTEDGSSAQTLIFVEDFSFQTHEFQSLKQASLGRLAGSIAHEIRNPLSAIKHAAELIGEDENLDNENTKLLNIINKQSIRMDRIIKNVLQLSTREKLTRDKIDTKAWLEQFFEEFCDENIELSPKNIHTNLAEDMNIIVDVSHLHQIISNLVGNSIKYGSNSNDEIILYIDTYNSHHSVILEICDDGRGIPEEAQPKIFEPFYSGSSESSGLGLYIVKEMCSLNNIDISYHSEILGIRQKPYFRLAFPTQ